MRSGKGPLYTVVRGENALGVTHAYHGPGLPRYANDVNFQQPNNDWAVQTMAKDLVSDDARCYPDGDADRVLRFLHAAFEAGREAAFAELRALIGARQ